METAKLVNIWIWEFQWHGPGNKNAFGFFVSIPDKFNHHSSNVIGHIRGRAKWSNIFSIWFLYFPRTCTAMYLIGWFPPNQLNDTLVRVSLSRKEHTSEALRASVIDNTIMTHN